MKTFLVLISLILLAALCQPAKAEQETNDVWKIFAHEITMLKFSKDDSKIPDGDYFLKE